jgi:hypothetical protein
MGTGEDGISCNCTQKLLYQGNIRPVKGNQLRV